LELAQRGVHLLLVCPGAIDRPDAGERYQQLVQERGLDPNLAKPAGGARLHRIDPQRLCQQILRAAHRRQPELIVPSKVRWLLGLHALFPQLAERWLKHPRS
jgi:short-subunit dehydrogenase